MNVINAEGCKEAHLLCVHTQVNPAIFTGIADTRPHIGHTDPSTNPWNVLITEKSDVLCCAIFRGIHISWRWEAEPLLLSHLPQEAVNTSWPPLEVSSWVWRLLEPRGPPAPTAATSLSVKHTQIHIHWHTSIKKHKSTNIHMRPRTKISFQSRLLPCTYVCTSCHTGPRDHECFTLIRHKVKSTHPLYWPATFMFLLPLKTGWCNWEVM